MKTGRRVFYGLWALSILSMIVIYLFNPEVFTVSYLKDFIGTYQNSILSTYIALSLVRGFFLVPSTPFVLCGGLLFPEHLHVVLGISMFGVLVSATSLYYFSDMLGFSLYLERKYPRQIKRWKSRLQRPRASLFVLGWSFFPLVPTDLICYVAGLVKMPYRYMFIGVFIGELILNIFYIYFVTPTYSL